MEKINFSHRLSLSHLHSLFIVCSFDAMQNRWKHLVARRNAENAQYCGAAIVKFPLKNLLHIFYSTKSVHRHVNTFFGCLNLLTLNVKLAKFTWCLFLLPIDESRNFVDTIIRLLNIFISIDRRSWKIKFQTNLLHGLNDGSETMYNKQGDEELNAEFFYVISTK